MFVLRQRKYRPIYKKYLYSTVILYLPSNDLYYANTFFFFMKYIMVCLAFTVCHDYFTCKINPFSFYIVLNLVCAKRHVFCL